MSRHPSFFLSWKSLFTSLVALFLIGKANADTQVYQKLIRSTAWVVSKQGTGSAVVIDQKKKLLATNFHVVELAKEVKVVFPQFKNEQIVAERDYYRENLTKLAIKGKVIVRDPLRDLALIQLEELPDFVRQINIAKNVFPGAQVHTIGNPGASEALWVYSSGTVRQAYFKKFNIDRLRVEARVLETQNPINPGDSGGPLVNDKGELVGIVCGLHKTARLVSFGIDQSELRSLLAGEIKSIDNRLKTQIEQLKLDARINAYGQFMIPFHDKKKTTYWVYVESYAQPVAGMSMREVWIVAHKSKGDLSPALANYLLKNNSAWRLGGWQSRKYNETSYVYYSVRVPVDSPAKDLDFVIEFVANRAHKLQTLLRPKPKTKPVTVSKAKAGPTMLGR